MTIAAIFRGIFAVAEAIPVLRDGLYAALSEFYQKKMDEAQKNRTEGAIALEKAQTPQEVQAALGSIIRGKSF